MKNLQLQFVLAFLAGWINRSQQDVIEYLQTENQVYRELMGKKRPRFTNDQRRRLAAKAKKLERKALSGLDCIVTPDTLLRWYRNLIAKEAIWSGSLLGLLCNGHPNASSAYRRATLIASEEASKPV